MIGFVVKPTFAIRDWPSPSGIPEAQFDVLCQVPGRLTDPSARDLFAEDAFGNGLPRLNTYSNTKYCPLLKVDRPSGNANVWTISYAGPTDSAALRP